MYDIDEIGGARIGFGRVTWPFAKLLVNRNELRINASIIGNVYFRASDIISIEPSSVFAGDGIKVNHRVHGYSRKVIFLTFGSRDLIKRIENTGFLNNPSPIPAEVEDRILKYQSSGSFPMKWSVVIGLAIIWNFLFLGDQLGYFRTDKIGPIFNDLFPLLTSGIISAGGTKGGTIPTSTSSPLLTGDIANLIKSDSLQYLSTPTRPKAFLNWMVVDEEFSAVSSPNHVSGIQVPTVNAGDTMKQIVGLTNLVVRRNGWIYVYVSNESNQDVYFDNLVINFKHGPLVEQKDYYAFGTEIPGLSTKAIKTGYIANRHNFNGIEYDSTFSISEYDANLKTLDPLIGRWRQIDSKPDYSQSPYQAMGNNPFKNSDFNGDTLILPNITPGDQFGKFQQQFQEATTNLEAHGVGGIYEMLASNKTPAVSVVQTAGSSKFDGNTNTIYFNPTKGLTSTGSFASGISISPTTILNHELDHALLAVTNPVAAYLGNQLEDSKYEFAEEARVTTTTEQSTARALGEINNIQVTRTNHLGLDFTTAGPTTTQTPAQQAAEDQKLQSK